ncbi:muramoyltetrapeptide carboxypeptidase|uniref:muramoyltetrapeptide carboxypeptidase n=1 Tax=Noviherbaspirillum sp. L7-7A TaxID=2850560 RepID=UPI001C2B8A6C|nr:muramoyltetrapeptide carboxypeptidase [Noviherbaspirillum sp. L7-7A]MBV0878776.1 muramoyltetrapeptide carboxypeptidase [Noviherbaspirillum sp. L7-7A]
MTNTLPDTAPRRPGIAIVAPGGYAPDEAAFRLALARLEGTGWLVHNYYDPARKHQRFGGSDSDRAGQLHAAARDPDVDIIMALRGGYGMSRLLPMLDYELLAASGKRLVGHSDVTALQLALFATTGAPSFAGPMVCDDFTRPEPSRYAMQSLTDCLRGPCHRVSWQGNDSSALDVSGRLWGGNLAMVVHLLGTPYLPQVDGGILFVEDINEHPYRVERMLLQLLHAGVLARQRALVLGDFSGYRLGEYDNGYSFSSMLAYLRKVLPLPVATGLPFGHIPEKATLVVGSQGRLQVSDIETNISMTDYSQLPMLPDGMF